LCAPEARAVLKHYHLSKETEVSHPSLLWETRLDIHDVRSGFRGSDLALFLGPFINQSDVEWSKDLVKRLDHSSIEAVDPPQTVAWPAAADEKFIRHLLRHYRVRLWRNYKLSLYSAPQETKEDFVKRCLASLRQERSAALQQVQDIFLRRILEIEQLLLEEVREDSEPDLQERMMSRIRDLFSAIREDFSRSFLEEKLTPLKESDLKWSGKIDIELQERIHKLRSDLVARYNGINESANTKAASIEKYEVALTYSQIEVISRGVLWS